MMRYKRLPRPVYSDTMFSGVKSAQPRGNKCAQVYCADYGWTRCFPMVNKGDAHETCSLLFQKDGVPPKMVLDGSKEQIKGKFANSSERLTAMWSLLSLTLHGCRLQRVVLSR